MAAKLALLAVAVPVLSGALFWLFEMAKEFASRSIASTRKSR